MKYLIIFTMISTFFNSCHDEESAMEKFKRECPYPNIKNNQHQLRIPVSITPNQLTYDVGDTIHINATFSDSIYDINTEATFLIKNFPFDIGIKLMRFENDSTWSNGFRQNKWIIDSSYFQKYDQGGDITDVIFLDFVEEDNMYKFDMKLVLKTKGRYVFQLEDFIDRYPSEIKEEKIKPITFVGKCPTFGISPVTMIEGSDNILEFIPELVFIDKKLRYGIYASLKFKNTWESPFGSGNFAWEWTGTYCFSVE